MKNISKSKIGCLFFILAGAYLFFFQLPYLADPGLRDIHIRRKIKTLTKQDCADILEACERLYRDNIGRAEDQELIIEEGLPAATVRVGYKNAVISSDMVKFRAGAGGFSQVGPIIIICWMHHETRKAKYLALDDGRFYEPTTKSLLEHAELNQILDKLYPSVRP